MLARACTSIVGRSAACKSSNRRFVSKKPVKQTFLKRRNATATAAQLPTVYMHLDRGNHKLALPLPSGEKVFSLKEHLNVSSFIEDVLLEDPSVKTVEIRDKFGRVSKGTPADALLSADWTVTINGKSLLVKSPPRSLVGGHHVSVHPDLLQVDSKLPMFKSYVDSMVQAAKTELSLGDYIRFAEDKGVSKESALAYLRTLHNLGAVLFFEDNLELRNKILLNPKAVTAAVEKALSVPHLKSSTRAALEARLNNLKAQLGELQGEYETIDAKASRGANLIAYSVLGGLLFQWLLFARFTWWDFSWDVMEPVTYFTMTAELSLGGYLYYLWDGNSEYANQDAWTCLYNWRFRSIAKRRNFNIVEWNSINNGIVQTQEQITHYSD